jgi:hypothetical protein
LQKYFQIMRLGQLARQLEIKPEKIISFLAKEKDITIKEHPNSKVEDELIETITTHFKPVIDEAEEAVTEKEAAVEEKPKKVKKEKVVVETVPEEAPKTDVQEQLETIKSTFTGPKVVGKIDLPDKTQINVEVDGVVYDQETLDNKKKEELEEDRERKALEKEAKRKEEEERKKKAAEQRMVEAERQAMLKTEENNLLSKEEEKKKAIALKEQQERERKIDERRKAKQATHYSQQFKQKETAPPKKKKIKEAVIETKVEVEKPTHQEEVVESTQPKETNIFKRFLKWLNTE